MRGTLLALMIAGSLGGCGGSDEPTGTSTPVRGLDPVTLLSAAEEDALAEARITPANANHVFESLAAELQAELGTR